MVRLREPKPMDEDVKKRCEKETNDILKSHRNAESHTPSSRVTQKERYFMLPSIDCCVKRIQRYVSVSAARYGCCRLFS